MSDILNKILASADARGTTPVRVPEWGDVTLYFRTLTPELSNKIRRGLTAKDQEMLSISALQVLAVDERGAAVFAGGQEERVKLYKTLDLNVVRRVLEEGGAQDSPRSVMIRAAEDDRLRALLCQVGEMDAATAAEMTDDVLEPLRRVLLASEFAIAQVLDPRDKTSGPDAVKNG